MRIPLKKRLLPDYTTGEELFNSLTHAVAAGLSIAGLVLIITRGLQQQWNAWSMASGIIYAVTLIILYSMSALYHGISHFTAKRVFQIIDHCSIFLLIAGSYTPLTLTQLRREHPALAWSIFIVVWVAAVIGIVLNAIDLERFSTFSMICYLAMGWCIIIAFPPMRRLFNSAALQLLLWGGIAYSVGALLYALGKKKYTWFHGVFHVFVIIGSVLHYLCIFLYILPN